MRLPGAKLPAAARSQCTEGTNSAMSTGQGRFRLMLLLALGAAAIAAPARLMLVDGAFAQPPSEEDKKKKEREKQKPAPEKRPQVQPPPQKGPPPTPPRASPAPTPPPAQKPSLQTAPQTPPPVEKRVPPPERQAPAPKFQGQPQIQGQPPADKKTPSQMQGQPQIEKKGPPQFQGQPLPDKKGPPPQFQGQPAPDRKPPDFAKPGDPRPDLRKDDLKRAPAGPGPRDQALPPAQVKPAPQAVTPPNGLPKDQSPAARLPGGPAVGLPGPRRFEDVRKDRQERVEDGGRRRVIQEPGNRTIVREDNRAIIRHDEAERFNRRPGARSERRQDGTVETFYVRPDGVRVVTVVDTNGRLIRRYRRDRDGRERNIIDNRRFYRNLAVGVGIGVVGGIIALNLPPPRITIPRDRYIVEYEHASDDDLYETLEAPPIDRLDRAYSLEEIRDNYELRARVRRIDLDTVNFEFGSWEVGPDQYHKLERIARAILRLLERNPDAVVMVEGHTDAVGSDEDNLSLSDRRASAVAEILSDQFGVPPENLVTQGYGEQYLKVETQGPERLNRRVTILNITELMAER
jgi:outer membrane protein OmpA-like peptidoglycan-associated protein